MELHNLPAHLSLSSVVSGVQSLVSCVVLCRSVFVSLSLYSYGYYIVCFSIYGFWLSLLVSSTFVYKNYHLSLEHSLWFSYRSEILNCCKCTHTLISDSIGKLSLVQQGLLTLQEYLCLSPVSCRVYVDQFLVFYVVFCRSFFVTSSCFLWLIVLSVFLRRPIILAVSSNCRYRNSIIWSHRILRDIWGILLSERSKMYMNDYMIVLMKIQNNIKNYFVFISEYSINTNVLC